MPSGRTQLVLDELVALAPGNLASKGVVAGSSLIDNNREQGSKLRRCKAYMEFRSKTANEGPLIVGLTGLNYTTAEIAEALTADPQKHEDPTESDHANRKVFPVWVIPHIATGMSPTPNHPDTLLTDIQVPSWVVDEGELVRWFVFNADTSAVTTGILIIIVAQWVAEWLHD